MLRQSTGAVRYAIPSKGVAYAEESLRQVMNDCLVVRIDNIFVELLANGLLLAAIFALILPI